MELMVNVRHGSAASDSHDVQITADATATVGDLASALVGSDRLQGVWPAGRNATLRIVDGRAQTTLPRARPLLESGIRSGGTLELAFVEDAPASDTAAALLRVLSGPDQGAEFSLLEGSSTIGRSSGADVD